ncbi:MAG: hypothetical protein F4X56_05745 [Gammaproteobacteria bacterium]|nr:hypothetical protein [Gammaproteobacteria bacterium]MYC25405.1 hypothetical protein [Gammaproteobacteria bacterium]
MEWDEYRKICDHPSVLTRWLIEQTLRVCDGDSARVLESVLESVPIAKPLGHKGGYAIDMFKTSLKREDVAQIVSQVERAVKTDRRTNGPVERDYTHIEKTWLEYLRWCDEATDSDHRSNEED